MTGRSSGRLSNTGSMVSNTCQGCDISQHDKTLPSPHDCGRLICVADLSDVTTHSIFGWRATPFMRELVHCSTSMYGNCTPPRPPEEIPSDRGRGPSQTRRGPAKWTSTSVGLLGSRQGRSSGSTVFSHTAGPQICRRSLFRAKQDVLALGASDSYGGGGSQFLPITAASQLPASLKHAQCSKQT